MKSTVASMRDARQYFKDLPEQLETYFDEAYQTAFQHLMDAFDEFFKLTTAIDIKAKSKQKIKSQEATDIGEYGLSLILKMVDLMEKLDLPNKRKEIEQITLIFATWVIQYKGRINTLEPLVNAFAHAANALNSKASLAALSEVMKEITMACNDEIKHDLESANLYRPWRLLLINRGIVAIRSSDLDLVRSAFDDLVLFLPQESKVFFKDAITESEDSTPSKVKRLILEYNQMLTEVRLH